MNIDKVTQTYYNTHMPFIYYNLDNMPNLLFTRMHNDYWKLCHFDGTDINDINLNLDINAGRYYHCQPTCYMTKRGIYCVSFCIQVNGKIYLYYSESKDILNLHPKIVCDCACGCINQDYIVVGYLSQYMYIYKNTQRLYKNLTDPLFFDQYIKDSNNLLYSIKLNRFDNNFARVDYIPGENNKLLVSWTESYTMKHGSFLLDLTNKKGYDITLLDNQPLYKCAIDPLTEQIFYGKKIGSGFEDRKIMVDSINNIKFTEIPQNQLIINKY